MEIMLPECLAVVSLWILSFWDTVLWILLWSDCVRTWSPTTRFSGSVMLSVLLSIVCVMKNAAIGYRRQDSLAERTWFLSVLSLSVRCSTM